MNVNIANCCFVIKLLRSLMIMEQLFAAFNSISVSYNILWLCGVHGMICKFVFVVF